MKVEMKAKLLQYFLKKNDTGGFTKIGLLVRIFLYSCVAGAVLLPSYIRPCRCNSCHWLFFQTNCSPQVEARNTIGALNRGQQAYNLEFGGFATIENVGLGIKTETTNYSYHSLPNGPVQTSNDPKELAPSFEAVINTAQPKIPNVRGYIGVVIAIQDKGLNQILPRAIVCQEEKPSFTFSSPMPAPFMLMQPAKGEPQCPKGWEGVGE
ncbi:MAG: type IV pilin-like G/H family protein [Oscillatoria princeps RMCB-10]|nr:type IV pilin-like G/H family protein [Oscillatoria princeps RMCB-10]